MSTSPPGPEPAILHEFRALYDYVKLMGDRINQIYARIDRIEATLNDLDERACGEIRRNFQELVRLREVVVRKAELVDLFERLAASVLTLPELRRR